MKELNIKKIHTILLTKNEPETEVLLKRLKMTDEEIDDVLEKQTPNLLNHTNFSIISLSFPILKTVKTGETMLQTTFIINKEELILINSEDNEILNKAFNNLPNEEIKNTTSILTILIDEIIEESIKLIESSEEYINKKEKEIITGKKDKKLLIKMHNLKEAFNYVKTTMNANIKTIREILYCGSPYINSKEFSEHQEDRINYLASTTERLKEAVTKNIELFANLLSYKVNERVQKLTIVGSLLLIPTILSGFFGMNVTLPSVGFYEILGLSIILSIITYFLIK